MWADGRIEFPRTFLPVYCLLSPRLPVPFSFVPTYLFALQIPFLTSFPSFSYIFSVFFIQYWYIFRIFEYPSKILPFDNTKQKNRFLFCIMLTYSYLCTVKHHLSDNEYAGNDTADSRLFQDAARFESMALWLLFTW